MFFSIKGKILNIFDNFIVVENNNIGYKIFVSHPEIFKINEIEYIYLYNVITQTDQQLIGFKNLKEKEVFISLISIKGVGAKKALNILNKIDYEKIKELEQADNIDDFLNEIKRIRHNSKNTDNIVNVIKKQTLVNHRQKSKRIINALKKMGFKSHEIKELVFQEISKNLNSDDSQIMQNVLKKMNEIKNAARE